MKDLGGGRIFQKSAVKVAQVAERTLTWAEFHDVDVPVRAYLPFVRIFLGVVDHGLLDTAEEHVVLSTDPGERVAGP